VDIKSTYRTSATEVNGMTLGAFTGYFRNRDSNKNTLYPYGQYAGHFVLGVIYSKCDDVADERKQFTLDDLPKIPSVIREFRFFAQPKFRVASFRPGSGNTKNIGSVTLIDELVNGTGPFAKLGEEVYDDYWMFYLTRDMAQALAPYPCACGRPGCTVPAHVPAGPRRKWRSDACRMWARRRGQGAQPVALPHPTPIVRFIVINERAVPVRF
jgi:hypothetical protein